MRSATTRPQLLRGLALVAAALLVIQHAPGAEPEAAAPKPAKKDSNPRIRPPEVTLVPSIQSAEVKAGGRVTYQVSAKLEPGWHIYKYSKQQAADGPRLTTFDFFDTDGLKLLGDWTASSPPIRKNEPAFPDIPFLEYYEDEVTWSVTLDVPAGIEPGKKTLRCQIGFQLCDAVQCKIPGQWTLPDVSLTVLPAKEVAESPTTEKEAPTQENTVAALVPAKDEAPPADANLHLVLNATGTETEPAAPKPAKKDSLSGLRPREVTLVPSIEPIEAQAGGRVTYKVTAKLEPGWHIYKYSKSPAPGPRVTSFDFFDRAGLKVLVDWTPSRPPIRKHEPAFPEIPFLEYYEDEVTWSITLQVPTEIEPGKKTLRCQIGFQICDAVQCKVPGQWTLSDVALTVLPGKAVAEAPPAEDPAPPTEDPVVAAGPAKQAASPAEAEVVSEVAKQAELGLVPFLLFSALGGLGALVMPCVWPMVPITVNFFVKQGQKKGRTTGLAITYCLAIIGIFTSIGVLCSFFFSATALQNLANNAWLNTGVALLFLAFGLSLLGVFEIRLPNFLLNASSQGESRGGLIGVVFMALTLTITSFTCTFPVVGGLIVMAAKGQFFYPIVGLATFSTVLALPFFLLALSPGLLSRMPRSGDWMNSVKVVGGLIEIGAAFKFINTAEIGFGAVPEEAWFDAQVVLSCWVVLAAVCGLYLLGLFRTDHDHEEVRVGPGRMLIGSFFLGIALFLAPALFRQPPESKIWFTLVGLLPPDIGELKAPSFSGPSAGIGNLASCEEVKAQSKDPKTAEREQKNCHGVQWGMSFEAAQEQAKAEGRPILIDFTGVNCANCRTMETGVMPRPEIVKLLERFVTVQLYTDFVPIGSLTQDQREELAGQNQERLLRMGEQTNPYYVALTPDGKILETIGGYRSPTVFAAFLNKALSESAGDDQVAQTSTN